MGLRQMADENPVVDSAPVVADAAPQQSSQAVVDTSASTTSAAPQSSIDDASFLRTLLEKTGLEIPEGVASLDQFADLVDRLSQRASLLPEDATADKVSAWQKAATFEQQVASQWDEFQKWHSNGGQQPQQAAQPVQQQVAAPVQPQAPAAPEWKPRWEFPEISDSDLRFVEQDANGQYRPIEAVKDSMRARQIADIANQASLVTQDFVGNLTRKPYETASELFRPAMTEFEKRWETEKLAPLQEQIAQLQSMLNPVVEMTQQQQLAAWEAPYDDYLYTDSTKSEYTPAGRMYATLASKDVPLDQALAMVLEAIPQQPRIAQQTNIVSEPAPATAVAQQAQSQVQQQAQPQAQQKPQSFLRKRVVGRVADQRTGQPIEQTAVLGQDTGDNMLMSNEQLWDAARARAEQFVSRTN